ncbi:aminodeoxychorismate/anthranilate synthase component II [Candidatus Parcubacteria bacterium]|jgi:anthranilate synthase/aminodeoxychorismate synthase-like glutamine amidotransferase|nr:aminodeoxychorismate/anthranilate synthase component II [Candidatus Parcubacteria bacterium]MBT3948919.1 aminodeoxychorismate/anthranilate synthase component II [Candidatus Parcubacteria bacterium]
MKILIIDNYDSFTFNLYQIIGELLFSFENNGHVVDVKRNDEITLDEIKKENYDRIIISPGPGDARDQNYFGICGQVLTQVSKTTPTLGVCLGMQGIAFYYGGDIKQLEIPVHGKTHEVVHDEKGIFKGLPQNLEVMRYHSLMVDSKSVPDCLEITARIESGEIMGFRHKEYPIVGVQFHPESFATEGGIQMLKNFLFQE